MMAVSLRTEPTLEAKTPTILFEGPYHYGRSDLTPQYDVASDGRFLMIQPSDGQVEPAQINVVLNWFEELKRLVPTP